MDYRRLEILRPNHAGALRRKGSDPSDKSINYGVIRVENDVLFYYTYKAMSYFWKTKETVKELESYDEKYLIENGYIESIAIKDIDRVIF